MGHKKRKLRNFLIRPGLQLRFTLKIAGAALIISALNIVVFYHYIKENYEIFIDPLTKAQLIDAQTSQVLYQELSNISTTLITLSALFTLASILIGVVLTHKIAGPMVAFKRTFSQIKEGNTDARIYLRPRDEFKDVALSFNEMMDTVIAKKQENDRLEDDHEFPFQKVA